MKLRLLKEVLSETESDLLIDELSASFLVLKF